LFLHNLQTVLPDFKSNQRYLLTRWMQKHHVVKFLQTYKINPNYFIEEYAQRLISNLINMIENDFPLHQYLVTKEALLNFSDKDINLHDIFCLYQSLKDVCIELIEEGDILSSSIILNADRMIIDIYKVFERLIHDLLYFFAEEFFDLNSEYMQPA